MTVRRRGCRVAVFDLQILLPSYLLNSISHFHFSHSLMYWSKIIYREESVDRRGFMAAACAGFSLSTLAENAFGDSGPLTKIVFPFAAGGGGDTLCRILAQQVGQILGRTVIVENRTGGDGLIGIKSVKNASADGATILVTTGPTMYLLPMPGMGCGCQRGVHRRLPVG
jgi:hypothetical protein